MLVSEVETFWIEAQKGAIKISFFQYKICTLKKFLAVYKGFWISEHIPKWLKYFYTRCPPIPNISHTSGREALNTKHFILTEYSVGLSD